MWRGKKKTLQSLHQNIAGEKSRRLPTQSGTKHSIPEEEHCCRSQSASDTALNQLNKISFIS